MLQTSNLVLQVVDHMLLLLVHPAIDTSISLNTSISDFCGFEAELQIEISSLRFRNRLKVSNSCRNRISGHYATTVPELPRHVLHEQSSRQPRQQRPVAT